MRFALLVCTSLYCLALVLLALCFVRIVELL